MYSQASGGCSEGVSPSNPPLHHSTTSKSCSMIFAVLKTVLVANVHLAWVTPAYFVIFVGFPGFEEQNPLFL